MSADIVPITDRNRSASYAAEADVLAGVIWQPERLESCDLAAEHFTPGPHRHIWQAINDLVECGEVVDVVTVMERLEAAGHHLDLQYLNQLITEAVDANWSHKARLVVESAQRASFWNLVARAMEGQDAAEVVRLAEEVQLRQAPGARRPVLSSAGAALESFERDVEEERNGSRLSWGILDVDKWVGPPRATRLVVVAARPRMGKTAFATSLALANARAGRRVGIISLEQSAEELSARLLCNLSGCPMEWVRGDEQTPDADRARLADARVALGRLPIDIVDASPLTIGQVGTWARTLVQRYGCEMLIVDYLQRVTARASERRLEIGMVTRGLKDLSKQLRVPVIALAQMNREADGKRPGLANLGESAAIEQDADQIIAIHREQDEQGQLSSDAELLVLKNRHGRGDLLIRANYRGELFRFQSAGRGML